MTSKKVSSNINVQTKEYILKMAVKCLNDPPKIFNCKDLVKINSNMLCLKNELPPFIKIESFFGYVYSDREQDTEIYTVIDKKICIINIKRKFLRLCYDMDLKKIETTTENYILTLFFRDEPIIDPHKIYEKTENLSGILVKPRYNFHANFFAENFDYLGIPLKNSLITYEPPYIIISNTTDHVVLGALDNDGNMIEKKLKKHALYFLTKYK